MMTTLARDAIATPHLYFAGILRSEWIKLRTLRSTVWCYAIAVVLTLGLGFLLATTFQTPDTISDDQQQGYWVQVATLGIAFSQLVVSVLGALVITGEYGTGMIRSTLTAVPKRLPALLAKLLVFGVTTFVISLIALVGTAFVTAPLLPAVGINPDFSNADVWWALLGGAAYLALIGMLALSIGAIIRNSAGGIAASLGLLLVVPVVLQILAAVTRAEWAQNLGTFLPSAAGGRMYAFATTGMPEVPGVVVLEPWQGTLVLVAWVVLMFAIAAGLLRRRDA